MSVPESRPGREAADGARLEHGDGRISIAGAPALEHPACSPGAKAPGLFGHTGPDSDLLALPDPSRLGLLWRDGMTVARELDLRTGVLQQRIADGDASAVVRSFCCLARPGTYVLRADGDAAVLGDGPPLRAPAPAAPFAEAREEPAPQGLQILRTEGIARVLLHDSYTRARTTRDRDRRRPPPARRRALGRCVSTRRPPGTP